MKDYKFTEIQEKDLDKVLEIYNYYVEKSTATFHLNRIKIDELRELIFLNHPKYKSYLIYENEELYGYCGLLPFKKKQAYDRTAELTIYLKPNFTGKGIGGIAVKYLEQIAKKNNFSVLIGIVSNDNIGSIKFFKKLGYEKCAHFKRVGEKFGKILDVVAYQKVLEKLTID